MYTVFNNFVNIFSFNPKKLSFEKVGSDDLGIYYIYYDEGCFYLVMTIYKGILKKMMIAVFVKYLNLIFKDKKKNKYLIGFGTKLEN